MSSERAIQGKNVTVNITINGVKLPYLCATDCEVHFTTELIRRTSPSAGSSAKYKARMTDTTASLSGVTQVLPVESGWTVFDLIGETVRKNGVDLEMEFLDSVGNYRLITGHALMPDIDISASMGDFARDSIDFQFSGAPGVFNEPPPNYQTTSTVNWELFRGTNGETGITDNRLIGRAKVAVHRGDWLNVITTGTPDVQQVKFNNSTGQLLFSVPIGPGEPVFYQWNE